MLFDFDINFVLLIRADISCSCGYFWKWNCWKWFW